MRIALTVETFLPKIDGIVNIACRTLDFLNEKNISAIVIAPDQGIKEYKGTSIIGAPCIVNPKYPEGRIGFPSLKAHRAIKAFKPDLVHLIDPAFIGLGGVFSAKTLGIPTVASYHLSLSRSLVTYGLGIFEKPVRQLRVWGFNYVDHALAPSKQAQRMLRGYGIRRVGWWRRGVDSENFSPALRSEAMRTRFGITNPNEFVMLYVGRFAPDKQIEQFKPILEALPNARLVLVGGGPQEEELRALFSGLPVTFMGYLKGKELATAYASADLFVFASAHESFGLVLAEAIASGLPVVSCKVGGAEDIVQHGVTGYLFEMNDVAALVNYVCSIANLPDQGKEMGRKARAYAETLTWNDMMEELVQFYEDILVEKGRGSQIRQVNRPKSPLLQPK